MTQADMRSIKRFDLWFLGSLLVINFNLYGLVILSIYMLLAFTLSNDLVQKKLFWSGEDWSVGHITFVSTTYSAMLFTLWMSIGIVGLAGKAVALTFVCLFIINKVLKGLMRDDHKMTDDTLRTGYFFIVPYMIIGTGVYGFLIVESLGFESVIIRALTIILFSGLLYTSIMKTRLWYIEKVHRMNIYPNGWGTKFSELNLPCLKDST